MREAGQRGADLIVVGVHGRSALDRLVFGSTAEHLIRRATCPILTVRSDARV
jgi:nucleotide-binding universal stress UspA family protein